MKKLRFYIIPLLVLAMLLVLPPTARAEAPTTTVMMYMCGTDLQSACVEDMYEMASVDLPDEVTVAVQAGGAYTWDDEDLTGEAINRFTIAYGTFNDLEVLPWQSMADKETKHTITIFIVHKCGGLGCGLLPCRPLYFGAVGSRRRLHRCVL